MSYFGDLLSTVFERRYRKTSSAEIDGRTTADLCKALLTSHGELSGVTLARNILDRYADMPKAEKMEFFDFMTHALEIDPDAVIATLQAYQAKPGKSTP